MLLKVVLLYRPVTKNQSLMLFVNVENKGDLEPWHAFAPTAALLILNSIQENRIAKFYLSAYAVSATPAKEKETVEGPEQSKERWRAWNRIIYICN